MSGLLDFLSNPIGSAVSAIGGIISNSQNARENEKNRQWNEKMWNLNNEYNSPTQVLQRYSNAGIDVNPNYLVTGSYNGGLASYAGNLDASRSMENPLKGFNLGIIEAKQLQNETKNIESVVETNKTQQLKNTEEANKAKSESENLKSQTAGKDLENLITSSTMRDTIAMAKERLIAQRNSNQISEQEYKNKMKEYEILEQKAKEAQFAAAKAEEEVNTQKAMTSFINAQELTESFKQQNLSAATAESYAKALSDKAQANYYGTEAWKILQLTPSEAAELEATIDKIHSDTKLNYETATKIAVDYRISLQKNDRDNYITYVRDKYGTNAGAIVANMSRDVGTRFREYVDKTSITNYIRKQLYKGQSSGRYWFTPKNIKK